MKRFKSILFIIVVMYVLSACGTRQDSPSFGENEQELSEELEKINSSECDKDLLEIVLDNYEDEVIASQLKSEDRIYRCFSIYTNGTFEELLTKEEKNVLFSSEKYDIEANPSSDKFLKLTINETDERYAEFKKGYVSVLLIYDESGENLLDSIAYYGAIDSRIKQIENDIYWEISELNSLTMYYWNKNMETVYYNQTANIGNSSIYDLLLVDDEVNRKTFICDEKDVRYPNAERKNDKIEFILSEIRTLTMREIVNDEELRKKNIEIQSTSYEMLSIDCNKYGLSNYSFLSGRYGDIFLTCDGYVFCIIDKTPMYIKMTKEEFEDNFTIQYSEPVIRWGRFLKIDELKPLYINGEVNPELLKELEEK